MTAEVNRQDSNHLIVTVLDEHRNIIAYVTFLEFQDAHREITIERCEENMKVVIP